MPVTPPTAPTATVSAVTEPAKAAPADATEGTPNASPASGCIDASTALSLAEPLFSDITSADFISCQGAVAVATVFWPNDEGATTAYLNDGRQWKLLAGSFGLRSVCETVWAYEPTFDIGCGVNFVWPYPDYFSVPQLGIEAVRGSGCGGDGTLGLIIPDGLWTGYAVDVTADYIDFDVACVYYGASAIPFIEDYLATTPEDERLDYNPDYWLINNNSRTRRVPLSEHFLHRSAEWAEGVGCVDPGPSADLLAGERPSSVIDSWLNIHNGEAQWLLTSCLYG